MENVIAEKLNRLQRLQEIDSELDAIKKVRGDLPEEIQDLEDEIVGYQTRLKRFDAELAALDDSIMQRRGAIKDAERMIQKYEDQQMNVRNNREYDAITKEKELQELEIQISQKKIKESEAVIEQKKQLVAQTQEVLSERSKDLNSKRDELKVIMAETAAEEEKLMAERNETYIHVEERLYRSYTRIRENARNGLAVVTVKRGACGGCFNLVPPQRQADIRERKKLIACEHCGRILSDVDYYEEPKKPARKVGAIVPLQNPQMRRRDEYELD